MSAPAGKSVKIIYFAWVRERIGRGEEMLAVPAEITTVGDLMSWLGTLGPGYAEAFRQPEIIRAALDHTHCRNDATIAGAREIAFFPPVTGG